MSGPFLVVIDPVNRLQAPTKMSATLQVVIQTGGKEGALTARLMAGVVETLARRFVIFFKRHFSGRMVKKT